MRLLTRMKRESAQFFLEIEELMAERRLGQVQARSGAREASFFGDGPHRRRCRTSRFMGMGAMVAPNPDEHLRLFSLNQ